MLDARVADLTIVEFKALVREVVEETLADLLFDPDEGLELTSEIQDALRRSLKAVKEGGVVYDASDVASRLGLEDSGAS
ncbi:MAG: hypothetical protein HY867_17760 [Chloroflexi bacterium]|nr:hypothetical protein [Chloroflexota bacterium]